VRGLDLDDTVDQVLLQAILRQCGDHPAGRAGLADLVIGGIALERIEDLAPDGVVVGRLVRPDVQVERRAGLGEGGAGLLVGNRLVLVLRIEHRAVIAIAGQTDLDGVVIGHRAAHAAATAQVVVEHAIE